MTVTSSRNQPLAEGAELRTADDRSDHQTSTDGPFAVVLDAQRSATPGLGGKGTSLETLVASGHPVPATGVVTTAAYRAVANRHEITELVDAIINGEAPDRDRVDAAFAAVPIDDGGRA